MSLRSRIVLILVVVVVGWAAIDNGALRVFARKIFESWERQEAAEDLARIHRRLDTELAGLRGQAAVYAGFEALARFVAAPDARFVEENLGPDALERAGVDLLYVVDADGRVAWGLAVDPETRQPMRVLEFPRESLATNHVALNFRADEEEVLGVLMTKQYPLLFCSHPIPGSDGRPFGEASPQGFRGAAHGCVVLGRFLGQGLKRTIVREELEDSSHEGSNAPARIELYEPSAEELPPQVRDAHGDLFLAGADGLLHAYQKIDSLRTGAPLVLHVALERVIAARGKDSVNYALLSTLASALLILFVLLRVLQRSVVEPLSALTGKAVEIGRQDDTSIRVGMKRTDEIGQLAGEFDRMLEKLARSREQVVETARLAGMSEIATGVLHNVGNVLNSVNVAANLAARKTEDLSTRDLEMLVGVLNQHQADLSGFVGRDPRGKHLVPFLGELSRALDGQKRSIQEELRSLNQGIEHMAELVRAQQSYAGTKGVFEKAVLHEQVEAALRICNQSLGAGSGVEIVREFEPLPSVRVDRHKLMEILVNVLQNAGQAMAEAGVAEKRLHLRITRPDARTARLEVADNGVGIPHENLTKVFNHGFTTKKGGHGFGLHVSANAATEMGAKLSARSEGTGRGATFVLDIAMEEEPALAAA